MMDFLSFQEPKGSVMPRLQQRITTGGDNLLILMLILSSDRCEYR
jgi:hypothetical protein